MALDFSAIFHGAPVPGMVLDRDLKFYAANAAYLTMVGKTEDELIGRYVFDVFPESEERIAAMESIFMRTFEGETPSMQEIPFEIERNGIVAQHWWTAHHAPLRDAAGEISHIVQFSEDVSQEVRLRDMKNAMMGELQHRVGNLFTVVRAMARQTARRSDDVAGFLRQFDERLAAFFTAQKQLKQGAGAERSLRDVIAEQLSIFDSALEDSLTLDGPDLQLTRDEAQAISMTLHELGTNALKYGALLDGRGAVTLSWSEQDGQAHLAWIESVVTSPGDELEQGYGTSLLLKMLPRQLDGTAERVFENGGMRYELRWPRG